MFKFFLPKDFNSRLSTFCVHKREQAIESFTWLFPDFQTMEIEKIPLGNFGQKISMLEINTM